MNDIPAQLPAVLDGRLPELSAEESEPRFRALVGKNGDRRGIRLEGIYWDALARLASQGKMSVAEMADIAAGQLNEGGNLASFLRVIALKWALRRLNIAELASSTENLNALVQASPSPTIVLTREKRIQFFNEPFLTMLRQKLPLANPTQLLNSLRLSVDMQIAEAIQALETSRGRMISTGFSASCANQTMRGQLNLALAPHHERQMVIGYIARS